jgi:hypothetical protein
MSLFVEKSPWIFLVLTVIMGGGAAYMAGAGLAKGWKPIWLLVLYMLFFTAGVRFLHYALFESQLTSLQYFLSHGAIVLAFALLGYRITRVNQMTSQYPWLYEKTSALAWRDKT